MFGPVPKDGVNSAFYRNLPNPLFAHRALIYGNVPVGKQEAAFGQSSAMFNDTMP
jgi:hypothetical protein